LPTAIWEPVHFADVDAGACLGRSPEKKASLISVIRAARKAQRRRIPHLGGSAWSAKVALPEGLDAQEMAAEISAVESALGRVDRRCDRRFRTANRSPHWQTAAAKGGRHRRC
jgi:hypothetical protein